MSIKNVLIVCWEFPPSTAIGGRRWSKIAKSLLKLNLNVSIISSITTQKNEGKAWIEQEYLSKLKLYHLKKHFLVDWLNDYASSWKSLKIRAAKLIISRLYKGTIFDKAIGIESEFLSLAEEVIKSNSIDVVFVTGAPFNLVYYSAKLKKKFPTLKIIADYRDPWINAQNYGMKDLSDRKRQEELCKQNYVFETVDCVTVPNAFLLKEIEETYTGSGKIRAQFVELPHAFDPDDVLTDSLTKKENKIRIVYAGAMYIGSDDYLKFLNNSINYLKSKSSNQKVEFLFYTNDIGKEKLFKDNSDCVKFFKSINERIFHEIVSADAIMMLLSDHNKNYVTSKFYEFIPYRKPYLYVGPEGYVSQKIRGEQLGYALNKVEDLYEIFILQQKHKLIPSVNIEKYTFDVVTAELMSNVSKLYSSN